MGLAKAGSETRRSWPEVLWFLGFSAEGRHCSFGSVIITPRRDNFMTERRSKEELLEIVQDNDRACVDRGAAVVELVQFGMSQAAIAESAKLSTAAISHLKTCFRNLEGQAREM